MCDFFNCIIEWCIDDNFHVFVKLYDSKTNLCVSALYQVYYKIIAASLSFYFFAICMSINSNIMQQQMNIKRVAIVFLHKWV